MRPAKETFISRGTTKKALTSLPFFLSFLPSRLPFFTLAFHALFHLVFNCMRKKNLTERGKRPFCNINSHSLCGFTSGWERRGGKSCCSLSVPTAVRSKNDPFWLLKRGNPFSLSCIATVLCISFAPWIHPWILQPNTTLTHKQRQHKSCILLLLFCAE